MNKKIFLIGLLACLFRFAGAAETEFEPLISEDKIWEYRYYENDYTPIPIIRNDIVKFEGMTTVNGKEYHNLFLIAESDAQTTPSDTPYAYLREKDGEVFMIRAAGNFEDKGMYLYGDTLIEFKIYDFNMKPGDSFRIVPPNSAGNIDQFDMPVTLHDRDAYIRLDSLTTGIFEGRSRKIQHLSVYENSYSDDTYSPVWSFRVIEGLGIEDGGYLFAPYTHNILAHYSSSLELESVTTGANESLYRTNRPGSKYEPIISDDKIWEYRLTRKGYLAGDTAETYYVKFNGGFKSNGKYTHYLYMHNDIGMLDSGDIQPLAYCMEGQAFTQERGPESFNDSFSSFMQSFFYDKPSYVYSFNVSVGGYLIGGPESSPESGELPKNVVTSLRLDSLYTKIFEGKERAVQLFTGRLPSGGYKKFHVVEGLGVIDGGLLCFPYVWNGTKNSVELISVRTCSGEWLYRIPGYTGLESIDNDNNFVSIHDGVLAVEATGEWTLTVHTVSGQTASVHTGSGPESVNIASLPSGIYIAQLKTSSGTQAIKFAK